MPASRYGWDDLRIDFDDSGGTPQNMSAYIKSFNGLGVNAVLEECTPAGASWEVNDYAGSKNADEITIQGWYDDTAAVGPKVIFDAIGAGPRTFKVTYGSTKYSSVETYIKAYNDQPARKGITMFNVILRPTGAVSEN